MFTRYLAIRGQFPIRVDFKTTLDEYKLIEQYTNVYGIDFISLSETYEQALNDIMINELFIGSLDEAELEHQPSTDTNTIEHLEKCLQL